MLGTRRTMSKPGHARFVRRRWRTLAQRATLAGHAAFLVGSVLFLSDASETIGVWLFIFGSATFLIDGLGRGGDAT